MTSFFLALVLFPEVGKRAQAELDVVLGRDRLPTFDDRSRLPYIEAICRELLRWQMVAALGSIVPYQLCKLGYESYPFLGVPHASTEDDIYKGFFIPKGPLCFSCLFCPYQLTIVLIYLIQPNRIGTGSQCMVRTRHYLPGSVHLTMMSQGNPARSRDIPRSRGIQT